MDSDTKHENKNINDTFWDMVNSYGLENTVTQYINSANSTQLANNTDNESSRAICSTCDSSECCCIFSDNYSTTVCLPPFLYATSDIYGDFCCATPIGCCCSNWYGDRFIGTETSSSCCLTNNCNMQASTTQNSWFLGANTSTTTTSTTYDIYDIYNFICTPCHFTVNLFSDAVSCIIESISSCGKCMSSMCNCNSSSSNGEGCKVCGVTIGGGGVTAIEATSRAQATAATTAAPAATTAAPQTSALSQLMAQNAPSTGLTHAYSSSKLYNSLANFIKILNCHPYCSFARPTLVSAKVATIIPAFAATTLCCACPSILDNLKNISSNLMSCRQKKSTLTKNHRSREWCVFVMTWLPCILSGLPSFPRGGFFTGTTLLSSMSCAMDFICQSRRNGDIDYIKFQLSNKIHQILGSIFNKAPHNLQLNETNTKQIADIIIRIAVAKTALENAKKNPMTRLYLYNDIYNKLCCRDLSNSSLSNAKQCINNLLLNLINAIKNNNFNSLQDQIDAFDKSIESINNEYFKENQDRVKKAKTGVNEVFSQVPSAAANSTDNNIEKKETAITIQPE